MNTYKAKLKHDKGTVNIKVNAESIQHAKQRIINNENCPECAIIKISKIN